MNKSILTFSVMTLFAVSCGQKNKSLYESTHFRVLSDRVEQGEFTAKAVSDTEMTSNYQSNSYFSSVIQFKFSIKGKITSWATTSIMKPISSRRMSR